MLGLGTVILDSCYFKCGGNVNNNSTADLTLWVREGGREGMTDTPINVTFIITPR